MVAVMSSIVCTGERREGGKGLKGMGEGRRTGSFVPSIVLL